jgi:hypothetical protein
VETGTLRLEYIEPKAQKAEILKSRSTDRHTQLAYERQAAFKDRRDIGERLIGLT